MDSSFDRTFTDNARGKDVTGLSSPRAVTDHARAQ